mgnify:CR=1 FL=1
MKMEERIAKRLVKYYRSGDKRAAFRLSLLYWHQACWSRDEEVAVSACIEGFYWLKNAGYSLEIDLEEPDLQLLKETLRRSLSYYLKNIAKKI